MQLNDNLYLILNLNSPNHIFFYRNSLANTSYNLYNKFSSEENFRQVCRGIIPQIKKTKRVSTFLHRMNPFLLLAPFKIQILSSTPIKVIYYDFFNKDEMEWMEKFSIEKIRKKQEIKEKTSIAEGYKKTTQIQMTNAVELRLESSKKAIYIQH